MTLTSTPSDGLVAPILRAFFEMTSAARVTAMACHAFALAWWGSAKADEFMGTVNTDADVIARWSERHGMRRILRRLDPEPLFDIDGQDDLVFIEDADGQHYFLRVTYVEDSDIRLQQAVAVNGCDGRVLVQLPSGILRFEEERRLFLERRRTTSDPFGARPAAIALDESWSLTLTAEAQSVGALLQDRPAEPPLLEL